MDEATRRSLQSVVAEVEAERATSETLRELARNLDRTQRMIAMQLGQVYALPPTEPTAQQFADVRADIARLCEAVPAQEYYKTWSWAMRNAAFGACFTYYLGTGLLLSKEQTADVLGMHVLPSDRMMLATDEYLHGLISMANELPRLAMNAVTAGDFGAPVRIAAFVKQLHAAFQVLNLKNDILRKRFDGLKYDVKRVEEIMYDIRLRNLASDQAATAPHNGPAVLLATLAGHV